MNLQVGWGIPGGATSAGLLGVALLVVAVLGSRPRVAGGARRATLLGLRWVSAIALFLLGAQPALWGERVKRQPGVRAVVLDDSQSMGVAIGGPSRAARAGRLAARWAASEAGRSARWYQVSEELRPFEMGQLTKGAFAAHGAGSKLSAAIDELAKRVPDLGAIVLVSDGADTSGKPPLKKAQVQVHAVAVDDARALKDDAIVRMHPDPVAFLHGEGRVQATLRSTGLGPRTLQVSLRRGSTVLSERTLNLVPDRDVSIELPFAPAALGREVYSLRIEGGSADDVPENNERVFLVQVIRERLRILHVSGRPSWDQRFLRGFLKRDPSVDLVSFFILRSVHDLTMSDPSELALIPFPTDELFRQHLTTFDLVILQDFDYAPYQMAPYLPLIRDYVEKGGGLVMVGGSLSFDGGGYAETAIADVMPVVMRPTDPAGAVIVEGEFAPQPVAELMRHPILDLAGDSSQARAMFQRLAPLEGANELLGLKGQGVALLEHPTRRAANGSAMPVLAVGQFGKGRTLAFATDTSWHWSMPTAGLGGDPAVYDRFWDRVVRFMTREPSLEPSQVRTGRASYGPKAPLDVSGVARDARYVPIAHARVSVLIRAQSGAELTRGAFQTDAAGLFAGKLVAPAEAGLFEVAVLDGDQALAASPFLVELSSDELSSPRPRPDWMRDLARATSATFVAAPEDADGLETFDATRTESLGMERIAPFGEPWGVFLMLALICLEWALRRRWGEV